MIGRPYFEEALVGKEYISDVVIGLKPITIRQVMDMICKYAEEANCETSNVNDRTIN